MRADTEVELRYPIRRIFVGCCAQTGRQKAENNGASAKLMTVFLIGFLRACALCYLIFRADPFFAAQQIDPCREVIFLPRQMINAFSRVNADVPFDTAANENGAELKSDYGE